MAWYVQALEHRLGTRLLNRTMRHLRVTEIGQAFYEQCVDILGRVNAAEVGAREMHAVPRGRLKVCAPIAPGSYLLFPALSAFLKAFPQVELQLMLNDRLVDLADERFDAAFRFGNLADTPLRTGTLRLSNKKGDNFNYVPRLAAVGFHHDQPPSSTRIGRPLAPPTRAAARTASPILSIPLQRLIRSLPTSSPFAFDLVAFN